MIEADRQILKRLLVLNQAVGEFVLTLIPDGVSGELRADGLREIGVLLAELGADMVMRAGEIESQQRRATTVIGPSAARALDWKQS